MHYHIILLYVLVALLIAAAIYYDFIKKDPIRISLFTESASDELEVPNGGFTSLFSFDNRFDKIQGKMRFYAKFIGTSKNNILLVRIADTNNKAISKEITLSDERTAVIELNLKEHVQFLRLQTKTSAVTGAIKLERLEIEYNI